MDDAQARALFAAAPVARLATVDAQGRPYLVPLTFCLASDAGGQVGDVIYSAVDAKPKTTRNLKRLRNIASNPAVAVLADHYEADWLRLWWVRADGLARVIDDGPDFDAAIAGLQAKYPQYRQAVPAGPVIVITVSGWSGWAGE